MNTNRMVDLLHQVIAAVKEDPKATPVEGIRFKTLSDGWVLDKVLMIEWGPSSSETMDWAGAHKYAEAKGGRLPTVKELRSLVDYDRSKPAIDTRFFSDTKTDNWYWTGTEVAGSSGNAWVVGFVLGDVGYGSKGFVNYVRPVRSSQYLIL